MMIAFKRRTFHLRPTGPDTLGLALPDRGDGHWQGINIPLDASLHYRISADQGEGRVRLAAWRGLTGLTAPGEPAGEPVFDLSVNAGADTRALARSLSRALARGQGAALPSRLRAWIWPAVGVITLIWLAALLALTLSVASEYGRQVTLAAEADTTAEMGYALPAPPPGPGGGGLSAADLQDLLAPTDYERRLAELEVRAEESLGRMARHPAGFDAELADLEASTQQVLAQGPGPAPAGDEAYRRLLGDLSGLVTEQRLAGSQCAGVDALESFIRQEMAGRR